MKSGFFPDTYKISENSITPIEGKILEKKLFSRPSPWYTGQVQTFIRARILCPANLQIDKPANDTTSPNATELCPSDSSAAAALIDDVSATPAPLPPSTTPVPAGEPNRLWVMLFLAQLLVGFGSTHIYSYGASYVDDYAGKARSPLYFGENIVLHLEYLGAP